MAISACWWEQGHEWQMLSQLGRILASSSKTLQEYLGPQVQVWEMNADSRTN